MQFPKTEQELDRTINFLKSKGASNEEMKAVITEFASQRTAPDTRSFGEKAGGKVVETAVGAIGKASELGEKGIKSLGRLVTPKKFEERLGFAKEPTANEQLFGEGGFDERRMQERIQEVKFGDIVEGAKQGFQEAGESIERRGEIMNPIAEQKGILGEGAMKTGKRILNVLDYASKTIGGAVAPVITPVIEETIASMTPESQQQLQTSIEDLTAKFEALPPEQQEGIRSTGILGEALTAMIGTPFVARGAKQAVKAGRELATEGVEQVTRISEQVAPKFAPLIQKVDDLIDSPITDEATIRTNLEPIAQDISREYFNQVSPSVQRELLDVPELKDQYTKALVDGYIDETAPSLLELGATRVKNAIDTIEGKIKATGNKLGDFREKISTVQVQPTRLDPVLTKFDAELGKFGLKYENGAITEVSGRKTKLSPSEIRQLEAMRNDLIDIKASPTAQMIIDVRSKIDSDINFAKDRRDISSNLDGIAKSTRADLAKINREVIGKEQSAILERYSDLQDLIATYRKLTSKGNNIEFFLKRIMSERGRQPKSLTNLIKEETGTDLFKDALIIDNLVKDLAPDRMKSRLAQEVKDSGIDAGLALTALVSPQAAVSKFAADQALSVATKFLRIRFGKNAKLLKALDELQKNDKALLELRKMMQSGDVDVKGWSNVDETIESSNLTKAGSAESALLEEAKRYKTADEFVKAQGTPVYRGGIKLSDEKITNAGISVSTGKNVAEDFAKQKGGKVEEIVISPTAKIIDYSDVPNVKFKNLNDYSPELDIGNKQIWKDLEVEYQKAVNWATGNGYDGVKLPLEGETRIINKDVIKTKSQLKQIWEEANK